jgi:hypothetical protein
MLRRSPIGRAGLDAADTAHHISCDGAILPFQLEDADVLFGSEGIVSLFHTL